MKLCVLHVCMWVGHIPVAGYIWKSEDNFCESFLSFHCVGSRYSTQVVRLGHKLLFPLSHLAIAEPYFLSGVPCLQITNTMHALRSPLHLRSMAAAHWVMVAWSLTMKPQQPRTAVESESRKNWTITLEAFLLLCCLPYCHQSFLTSPSAGAVS